MTWISENYAGRSHEIEYFYQPNNNNMNGIGKLSWVNVKSALMYGVTTGLVLGVLAIFGYVLKIGDLWGINWKALVNVGAMSVISGFVMGVSLVKNLLTTNDGNYLGSIKVIPPTN